MRRETHIFADSGPHDNDMTPPNRISIDYAIFWWWHQLAVKYWSTIAKYIWSGSSFCNTPWCVDWWLMRWFMTPEVGNLWAAHHTLLTNIYPEQWSHAAGLSRAVLSFFRIQIVSRIWCESNQNTQTPNWYVLICTFSIFVRRRLSSHVELVSHILLTSQSGVCPRPKAWPLNRKCECRRNLPLFLWSICWNIQWNARNLYGMLGGSHVHQHKRM